MADFYSPQSLEKPADYTRDSQGYKADTSKGTLFEGLGNLIGGAAKSIANDINLGLRAVATKDVDQIQDFFILSDRVDKTGKKALPSDIEQAAEKNSLLRDAVKAGRTSQSTYWMMLDASARELRARFPGFREEIDNIYQDTTGAIPANKVVAEAFQKRASGASTEDKELKYQEHLAQKEGNPDYLAALETGTKLSLSELTKSNTKHLYSITNEKRLEQRINLGKAKTEEGYREADKVARPLLLDGVDRGASLILNKAGITGDSLNTLSDKMLTDINAGKEINPVDKQALAANVVQLRNAANQDFDERMTRVRKTEDGQAYRLIDVLNNEQRAQYRKEHKERVDQWLEPFAKGDVTMLSLQKIFNEASEEQGAGSVYRRNDWVPKMKAMQQALGSQLANTYMASDQTVVTSAGKLTLNSVFGDMFHHKVGVDQMFKSVEEARRNGHIDDAEAKRVNNDISRKLSGMLQDKSINPKVSSEIAERVFGGDIGTNWFSNVGNATDRRAIYQRFTDPRVAERVLSSGNAEVRNNYKLWVDQYGTNEIRTFADNASSQFVKGNAMHTVEFDPKTLSFSPANRESTIDKRYSNDVNEIQYAQIRDTFLKTVNPVLFSWANTMEKTGVDKQALSQRVMSIFEKAGVDLKVGPVLQESKKPKPKQE